MPTKLLQVVLCSATLGFGLCASVTAANDSFVLRAERIMPVSAELPWEISNGVMIVRDGRIEAIGTDIKIPPDLQVIDLPHATVVPGLVSAASTLGGAHRGDESIAAGYHAADAFDRYGNFAPTLAAGVTTVHISPGEHRLVTGQGAVMKLAGTPAQRAILVCSDLAVNLGVAKPPLDVTFSFPASADVAIPLPVRQRPASRLAQFQALKQAVTSALANPHNVPFTTHAPALADVWREKLPLRIRASQPADILGSIRFLRESGHKGYLVTGARADRVADAIRSAGLPIVLQPTDLFRACAGDLGTDPANGVDDSCEFRALSGIKIALAPSPDASLTDLRLLAARASRQGLGGRRALEAITRSAAEVLGVADRVGSLAPGKDADFLVMTGRPLDVSSHVNQVYVQGKSVFAPAAESHRALVIRAGTIWTKPGHTITAGEILIENGKIVAVGTSVPHPPFARVIDAGPDGFVTPGFIDACSHLGLEGDHASIDNSNRLSKLFGAADVTDLRVCRAGVTTVLVTPYAVSSLGSPYAAIKTAGTQRTLRVIKDPVSVLFDASRLDPLGVAETLEKPLAAGKKYLDSWVKYDKDLKEFLKKKQAGKSNAKSATQQSEQTSEAKEPDPVTGTWELTVTGTPIAETLTMIVEMQLINTAVQGRIIVSGFPLAGSVSGTFAGTHLSAAVTLNRSDIPGPIGLEADLAPPDQMRGTVSAEGMSFPVTGKRTDKTPVEIKVTRRRLRGVDGRPLPPKINPALEPLKELLEKKIPVVAKVETAAQIRAVLDLLVDKYQLSVTLLNAEGAAAHAARLAEKKVTVIVPQAVLSKRHNRDYLQADDLARRGVSIAFQSGVEDGARHLPAVVLYAVERGLDADVALAALTIEAARAFKIENRVGSIEPGKDADLVIFNGHPFKQAGQVQNVVVDGQEVLP